MPIGNLNVGMYKQMSASAQVGTNTNGSIIGIFVSSASSTPTITVYDNTAGSGTKIIDTFTPVAATFYEFDTSYATALFVAIGGTVSCTVTYI